MIEKIAVVTFSPTGSTAKVAQALGDALGKAFDVPVLTDSFTVPETRQEGRSYDDGTLVIFGVPTYAGRVPNKALPYVQTLFHGQQTPAIAVVTYGNRSYDSSLNELRNELQNNGFVVIAAGAFAAPHAFARIGLMHPTEGDLEKMADLAKGAAQKIEEGNLQPVVINGDAPVAPYYVPKDNDGVPTKFLKAKPKTDLSRCNQCGICAKVCPMGSTSAEHPEEVTGICIKCQACIQKCPTQAKYFDDERFLAHKEMLETHYQDAAPSEIFL